MNYPLYFAGESDRWQHGGAAFIGLDRNENCNTYSTKYLVTEEQFKDVVEQENDGLDLAVNFDAIIKDGSKTLRDSWYGTILYLGEEDGYPIFTFTSGRDLDVSVNAPSDAYLSMIIQGLETTVDLADSDILDYLRTKPGIDGRYSQKELEELL
ncbi:hypothetical protein [Lentibacillus kimchii]|uniref:Uncharacterized protein n=1 Tax=Lentibacillus kimchii TaxID=1542911 RepID=A0ABW2UQH8_9BACI